MLHKSRIKSLVKKRIVCWYKVSCHSMLAVFLVARGLLSLERRSMGKKKTSALVNAVKQANKAMGPW